MILEEPDDSAYIEVKSELPDSPKVSWSLSLPSSCSAKELYDTLSRQIHQIHSSFDLFLVKDCGEFKVDKDEEKVLKDFGLLSGPANRNVLKIVAQKAMATPSIVISSANKVDEKSEHDVKQDISSGDRHKQHTSTGYQRYVGLVNQAATCYLNSLLQALFMTPEFRNSLYKWEFVGSREEMSKSIPYQLQKLFVSLQTSSHIAVETSKLTRSFGWDASDSWQQHDIQELCRVMFDALEQRFKHTDQADFINNLYQGQLIDYVTCLECKTEKTRLDTFLDIPLPVRPFGSNVAYNSIADALLAFIQPETLNGNNQYFCETCNKKCDAHKGLKFSQFPYILTLHLKRFDFDYSVMSRIKLTDRVEFPHVLNMNGYLCENARMASNKALEENDQSPVINDSNITDTGEGEDEGFSLGEALHRPITGSNSSGSNVDIQDEDEDVELSKGLSKQHEKNYLCTEETDPKGPYVYELFSVMIHSGSASGGHYHVYIKDFENGKWFCFDDKSVSAITNDDISMTFGGGSYRGYYSSSTNAYMLMYRQIDKKRNQTAMKVNEFPPHLKELMKKMQEEEEKERILRERDKGCLKRKVYCNLPGESTIFEKRLVVDGETTLAEATAVAYRLFFLEGVVPLEQCRLVSYDSLNKHIDVSFEGKEEKPIRTIYSEIEDRFANDFYLEIRDKDVEFQRYQPEEFSFKIYHVNMKSEEVKCLREVRIRMNSTLDEMKSKISDTLQISSKIKLIVDDEDDEPHIIFDDVNALGRAKRIFVAEMSEHEAQTDFILEVTAVLEKYINSVTLYFIVPDTDPESLAKLGITPVDGSVLTNGDLEKVHTSIFPSKSPSCSHAAQLSTLESEEECVGATGCSDQSTSEDSSLTDSDRTIVGDEADYCLAELSSASNSPPGSSVSSPEKKDQSLLSRMRENMTTPNGNKEDLSHNPQMTSDSTFCNNPSYPKHKITIQPCGSQESKNVICVKTDQRISLNTLEVALAQHLGVHPECVTIRRKCKGRDIEYKNMNSLHCLVGKDDLRVHLERCLKEGEFCGKVYLLIQDEDEPDEFLCYLNLADDMLVGEAKFQILEELRKRKDDLIPSYDRCRLRVKKWRTPGKVLFDSQSLHDVGLSYNCELYLQELDEQENLTSPTDVTVMLRRFSNTNLPMGYFHEITLKSSSLNELRETLHAITSIPLQSLEFARGVFPLYKKRTRISKDLFNWKTDLNLTLEDGTVVFYRKKDKDINSNMQEGESCNLSIQQDESTFDPKGEDDNNDNMIDPQKTRHHYRSYKSKTSKARTVLDEMRAKPSGCKHYDGKALKIGVSLSGDSLKDPADLE